MSRGPPDVILDYLLTSKLRLPLPQFSGGQLGALGGDLGEVLVAAPRDVDHHQVIAGTLLGAVAGFVQIIRTASRYLNRSGR